MTAAEFQSKLIGLQNSLMSFAYRLTADKEDAKDLVQETMLKALKYSDKFIHETNIEGWTFTIMRNTFINYYRRSVHYNTYCAMTIQRFYPYNLLSSDSYDPLSVFAYKELEKTVETLDDHFKLPFTMHNEGFKYREIAEILGMNVGTVKSRIFFSRKKLMMQVNSKY